MRLTVEIPIPEPLLTSLGGNQGDLSRRAFEAVIADQYRNGKLSHVQVSQLLALDRFETDGFLKRHAAFRPEELADYAEDFERFQKLAINVEVDVRRL
jgi:hypothetical protein